MDFKDIFTNSHHFFHKLHHFYSLEELASIMIIRKSKQLLFTANCQIQILKKSKSKENNMKNTKAMFSFLPSIVRPRYLYRNRGGYKLHIIP